MTKQGDFGWRRIYSKPQRNSSVVKRHVEPERHKVSKNKEELCDWELLFYHKS